MGIIEYFCDGCGERKDAKEEEPKNYNGETFCPECLHREICPTCGDN